MKKRLLYLLLLVSLFITACNHAESADSNPAIETIEFQDIQETTNETAASHDSSNRESNADDYSNYTGLWSEDGSIIKESGAEFNVEIQNDRIVNASLYTQTSSFDRFAEVENITGTIIDGACTYKFTDDGWGNSGTLFIQFKDDTITIEVQDFVTSDDNAIGYGVNGHFDLIRVQNDNSEKTTGSTEFKKYNDDWTEEQILEEICVRSPYREATAYYSDFLKYMEGVRECTDIAVDCYPLFRTDTQFYQASDFENVPPLIIHLAKNEIYARRGYIFNNPDLNNFYLTQLWYVPEIQAADFDDSVFNEYEKYNLELLSKLDTY